MATSRLVLACTLLALLASLRPQAQGRQTATIRVAETSGIRRTEYPIRAVVPVPQRAVTDASHARLRLNDAEAPAQYTVTSNWPDGSARSLDVDFNVTLAPGESRAYQLEYGSDVTAEARPRGMTVTQDIDVVQVGSVKFARSGAPLIASVGYVRSEFIGQFPEARNGFTIVDQADIRHRLSSAQATKTTELLKRGPLVSVLQYSGSIAIDGSYAVPFTLWFEVPNSKSWVKMSATIEDPMRRVKQLDFDTPLALGAFPWLWDFGTENGTYGAFRNPTDTVVFTQVVGTGGPSTHRWKVDTGTPPELRPYETSARLAGGWGHLQGAATAVAFGIDGLGETPGTYTVSLNGQGQASFGFSPSSSATTYRFGIYQHFVSTPVPIGAATTPASMLHPPTVVVSVN